MTTPNREEIRTRPVRTAADLALMWEVLMGGGGFGRRTLWLAFLHPDGLPVPLLVPIEDWPVEPDSAGIEGVQHIVADVGADGTCGSVVMLLSRPGSATMGPSDRAWARALAPISPWPIHLATADRIQVFAMDDLLADPVRRVG